MKKLSSTGGQLIRNYEELRLDAYRDAAGVWTIGYGSTRYRDGTPVKPGDKLANGQQADDLFINTLGQYTGAVNRLVKVPLTQHQFDALVSFTYNEGTGAFQHSTLLQLLNKKDYDGAVAEFLKWDKITDPQTGKKVFCRYLAVRRKLESQLFQIP